VFGEFLCVLRKGEVGTFSADFIEVLREFVTLVALAERFLYFSMIFVYCLGI
jgi:hypothetical protein